MVELSEEEKRVLLSFAERVDRNDPGALNNLGVLYFKKGLYEEAIKQFKEAIKLDSRFDLARENLQYLFARTNLEDPDVARWKKVVEEDPGNLEALMRLGVSYQNMGKLDRASEILGKVVNKNPDHVMARLHLGNVLKAQGMYQQSLEHYLAVSEEVSKSAVFHTDLGEIYYNLGRTEEAISELRNAIKLDADYWRSHFLLSFAYGDNGQLQEALEESRVASKLNPSFQNTEANLAISLSEGDDDSQLEQSSEFKGTASIESTSFTLGAAYKERGFYKEALKEYRKALQDMVEKDRVYVDMAKIHLIERKMDKAGLTLLKALEENPKNAEAFKLLGCINHLKGEFYRAAISYLQSFRLNSVDPDTLNNLGVLLYQIGLKEEAERMFKKGLNIKLYHMELNYNFLTCNLLKEDYMMAENLIQRIEAFMGKSALLYEKRAILNFKMNRLTLALFDIESALALDRMHSDAIYLRGLIFLREEQYNEAIASIVQASKIKPEYNGFSFFIASGERGSQGSFVVDSSISMEPDDELIELLESGISRRFDKIKEVLVSFVGKEVERAKKAQSAERSGMGNREKDSEKSENSSALSEKEGAGRAPSKDSSGKQGDGSEISDGEGESSQVRKKQGMNDTAQSELEEAIMAAFSDSEGEEGGDEG